MISFLSSPGVHSRNAKPVPTPPRKTSSFPLRAASSMPPNDSADYVREADTLIVTKPGRLARSTVDLLAVGDLLSLARIATQQSRWGLKPQPLMKATNRSRRQQNPKR